MILVLSIIGNKSCKINRLVNNILDHGRSVNLNDRIHKHIEKQYSRCFLSEKFL